MTKQLNKAAVGVFFAVLMLIGLLTLRDYSASYDELPQQAILRANAKEYALALQKAGMDCPAWLALEDAAISESVERDHGIAPMYLYLPFLTTASQRTASTLWSLIVWLWFMAGLWSLYALAYRLGLNRFFACLATLLLYLSPRFFAHAHFNDKDLVMLCLMLVCLWLGARLLEKLCWRRALVFSLAGALATNLRISGLLAWGCICLSAVVLLSVRRQWNRRKIGLAVMTLFSFMAFYILLTPACWSHPGQYFSYLFSNSAAFSRWKGVLFFRGAEFHIPDQPLPFYYIPYLMAVTLPLYTLPLAAVGQTVLIARLLRGPRRVLARVDGLLLCSATVCWLLPIAAYVLMRPVVYNGWRHFYFACAGLLILAAYGIGVLWRLCQRRVWLKRAYAAALCCCFALSGVGMMQNHPYEASYYNLLCSKGAMETDYWNTGCTGALKRLAACPNRNQSLPLEVGCYFFDLQNARFKLDEGLKARLTTTTAKDAPYLYYIENYVQVYSVPEPQGYHALFQVYSYGRLIGTMYEQD